MKKCVPSSAPPVVLPWPKKLLFALIICALLLAGMEVGLRILGFNYAPRQRIFYKPFVGMWLGTRDLIVPTVFDPPGYIWLMPKSMVGRDANGDNIYEWPVEKKPGIKRICFLGGSTSQPNGMTDYPRRTITLLNNFVGTNRYEGLHLGMSSYTTHQSLIALKRYGLPRNPDCVVVYHGWNDPTLQPDGYSDQEHSFWLRQASSEEPASFWGTRLMGLRITRLLGKLMNAADRSWPRLRVDFQELRANYEEMAQLCAARKIPFVLVKRPASHTDQRDNWGELHLRYFKEHYKLVGNRAIYNFIHTQCTNVQEAVAHALPAIRLADACGALEAMQRRLEQAPREGVEVFVEDACHCTPLGYQGIAEAVAPAIEPGLAGELKQFINSSVYWQKLALEFRQMDEPFLCTYAIEQAVLKDPSSAESLAESKAWAENNYQFWRLFTANTRNRGAKVPLDERLANLGKCLELRPSDLGVMEHINQAASWNGHPELAIPYFLKFKPTNTEERYGGLRLLFGAYLATRNVGAAEQTARELVALNPNDQDAKAFLMSRGALPGDAR